MADRIPKQEIALHHEENVWPIVKALIDENYVVMVSQEEELWIINYIWAAYSNQANRNDVVFMPIDDFEMNFYERCDDEDEE